MYLTVMISRPWKVVRVWRARQPLPLPLSTSSCKEKHHGVINFRDIKAFVASLSKRLPEEFRGKINQLFCAPPMPAIMQINRLNCTVLIDDWEGCQRGWNPKDQPTRYTSSFSTLANCLGKGRVP